MRSSEKQPCSYACYQSIENVLKVFQTIFKGRNPAEGPSHMTKQTSKPRKVFALLGIQHPSVEDIDEIANGINQTGIESRLKRPEYH